MVVFLLKHIQDYADYRFDLKYYLKYNLYVHTLNGQLKWFSVDDTTQRGCIDLKDGAQCN